MTWCFVKDGRWTGRTYCGPANWLEQNTPDGELVVAGEPAALIAADTMLPPEPPALDQWTAAWTWDAQALRYVPTPSTAALEADARDERARRLSACDWTQLPDVPAGTRTAWATYRQALRDVTDQPGFPTDIAWPMPPA